jgi:hypothetical protein
MTVLGKPAAPGDKGFKTGIGPFQVDPLGSFLIGFDEDLIIGGDAARQSFPEPYNLRLREPLQIPNPQTQIHLGVYLVDVLSPRPSRTGKTKPAMGSDGSVKQGNIHDLALMVLSLGIYMSIYQGIKVWMVWNSSFHIFETNPPIKNIR